MGCGCGKRDGITSGTLGYKVVASDGSCQLTVDGVCRAFVSASAAAAAARAAALDSWTVVPVRGV